VATTAGLYGLQRLYTVDCSSGVLPYDRHSSTCIPNRPVFPTAVSQALIYHLKDTQRYQSSCRRTGATPVVLVLY
jgi:hypothetical protein